MILRVYWKISGQNAHLKVFAGDDAAQAFHHAGNLVMTAAEFVSLTQGHVQSEFWEDDEGVEKPGYQQ